MRRISLNRLIIFTDLNREPPLSIAVKYHELTARVLDLAISLDSEVGMALFSPSLLIISILRTTLFDSQQTTLSEIKLRIYLGANT
jgi:hypothetical protein